MHKITAEIVTPELSNRLYEDVGVTLLEDILVIFEGLATDRIASAVLVQKLRDLGDGAWAEWRGQKDDGQPHKLTQGELAKLLRDFQIKPKTIRPHELNESGKTQRGYMRGQFEAAWKAYCPAGDTTAQAAKAKPSLGRAAS